MHKTIHIDQSPRLLWGAWSLLAAGLIVTALAARSSKTAAERDAQREFEDVCNQVGHRIGHRLDAASLILRSGAAFLAASESVTREDWRIFTRHLEMEQQLPGIQGIGFSQWIPREQLATHIQTIRAEGFPDYQVRPPGERERYSSIIYLEPFSDRNLRAFGYDMLSEPVRRAAMERARDENAAALSGKVILVQETVQDVQPGSLLYFPAYHQGAPIATIAQRRAAIRGWVYSPYRMTDLIHGTLEDWEEHPKSKHISLQIHDGDDLSANSLLYAHPGSGNLTPDSAALFTRTIPIDFAGHRWTLRFALPGRLAAAVDYGKVWLTLSGGMVISLLLFGLMRALIHMRADARQLRDDIAERKRAAAEREKMLASARQSRRALLSVLEDEKRTSAERARLAAAIEQSAETIMITDTQGLIVYVNPAFEATTGYSRKEILGQNPRILKSGKHDAAFYREMWATLTAGRVWRGHFSDQRKDGTHYEEEATISPVLDSAGTIVNYVEVKRDTTREVQLEAQLRQAQKMESIGRLAGGVAHDFNNLIMGIMGYTELARDRLPPNHPACGDLDEIMEGARRTAALTKQLLAFARKQEIVPQAVDLNDAIGHMLNMLRKLIGEDVCLAWMPGAALWPVKMDLGQVDQILANLCVNARDAISGVGNITIKTANDSLDESFCVGPPDAVPGDYVQCMVSDDGCGMTPDVLDKIFDPFFTTKGVGEGTGLGLSTVYGIVRQNKGFIQVNSEPGKGATFRIYLPRLESATTKAAKPAGTLESLDGGGDRRKVKTIGNRGG